MVKNIIVFDILENTGKILQYPKDLDVLDSEDDPIYFYEIEQKENKLYIYPYKTEQILILDMEKLTINTINTFYEESELNKIYEKNVQENMMTILENKRLYIEKFFGIIDSNYFSDLKKTINNNGRKIYIELL